MKAEKFATILVVATVLFASVFSSCKKGEGNPEMNLTSVTVNGTDIIGGTTTGVNVSANIIASFSNNVSPTTADSTNITLTNNSTNEAVTLTFTVSGSTITISHPVLDKNTRYSLMLHGILSMVNVSIVAKTIPFTTGS